MDERPVDLSALDPRRDDAAWEARVASVLARAEPELRRRAKASSPLLLVAGWVRPTLAAAAVAGVVAAGVLARGATPVGPRVSGVAEEMGLPGPVAEWLADSREPTHEDLMIALDGGEF